MKADSFSALSSFDAAELFDKSSLAKYLSEKGELPILAPGLDGNFCEDR